LRNSLYILLLSLFLLVYKIGFGQLECKACYPPFGHYIFDIGASSTINKFTNIEYTTSGSTNKRNLDFYSLNKKLVCKKRPLILILPGSGFLDYGLDPKASSHILRVAEYFSKKGYAVAVSDYERLKSEKLNNTLFNCTVIEAAKDVNAAIQYLLGKKELLQIDEDNVFIIGESAGGMAGLSALYSDNNAALLKGELPCAEANGSLVSKSLYPSIEYSINGFVGISTGTPTENIFVNRKRSYDTKLAFIHSYKDEIVPFYLDRPKNQGFYLNKPICGSGCITEKIFSSEVDLGVCAILEEILSSRHNLLESKASRNKILLIINEFIHNELYCIDCNSSSNISFDIQSNDKEKGKVVENPFLDIDIYPNPVIDILKITGLDFYQAPIIKLYDSKGNTVFQKSINFFQEEIDLSQLSDGIYILQAISTEHTITKKITKMSSSNL
jgi:hypothetical protein